MSMTEKLSRKVEVLVAWLFVALLSCGLYAAPAFLSQRVELAPTSPRVLGELIAMGGGTNSQMVPTQGANGSTLVGPGIGLMQAAIW